MPGDRPLGEKGAGGRPLGGKGAGGRLEGGKGAGSCPIAGCVTAAATTANNGMVKNKRGRLVFMNFQKKYKRVVV
jgi:hypothetical protein